MSDLTRRTFLSAAAASAGYLALGAGRTPPFNPPPGVPTSPRGPERPEHVEVPPAPGRKLGFAVVGLGKLAIEEVLPAFAQSDRCRVTALVTGHPNDKGKVLADRYGVNPRAVYTYDNYDQIRNNPDIDAVYIALPNALHAEFSIRAAQAGKHVLCEKPMATTAGDCQNMIAASRQAQRALMIAYRIQYEPHHNYIRALLQLAAGGRLNPDNPGDLGMPRLMVATNTQNQAPGTWRTIKRLAGGGSMVDVGIYCLNTARFLFGMEPTYVQSSIYSTPGDDRFREVEEIVQFTLWFGTGAMASCLASYGSADNKSWSIMTDRAKFSMDPAFPYRGLKLYLEQGTREQKSRTAIEIPESNQFADELDHFAQSIFDNKPLRTPGEEGLKDQIIIEAIYQAAQSGQRLKLG